jgi:hypothetical protein
MRLNSAPIVHPPEEAARRLGGISASTLVKLLREGGYAFVSLSPGAKPWGRGRKLWGMTDEQINAVIAGQSRRLPAPTGAGQGKATADRANDLRLLGWDGRDRLATTRSRRAGGTS